MSDRAAAPASPGGPDRPPLIAHVVYRLAVGGLENGVVNLINRLPADRWRHAVVSLTDVDPVFARRIARDDVPLIALHKPPGQGLWQYPALWRTFRRLRPAIVHTRNLAALEAQLPAWAAGVPGRVHGEHGRDAEDVHGTNRRHILTRRLYRPLVQRQVALSGDLAAYLRDKIGVAGGHIRQVCNGVDVGKFSAVAQRRPVAGSPFNDPSLWLAGTVGRMQTVKAQPILARAFVAALTAQPALRAWLRLVMVGDGPLRAECEAVLREAGLGDLAWFTGERADVADLMRGLDLFVLPSLVEGISNTILEAMACARPVLATNVGGNAELVNDGQTGVIVPAGDVQALARGLLDLAQAPQRARAMGALGRARVEQQFSLEAMVDAYQRVYDEVLRRAV